MGIPYDIDPETGIVWARPTGDLTLDDMLDLARRLAEDPEIPRPARVLWDGRNVNGFALMGTEVRTLLGVVAELSFYTAGLVSIVAPGDVLYGMARLAQALSYLMPFEVGVFRELEPGVQWLGPPPATRE